MHSRAFRAHVTYPTVLNLTEHAQRFALWMRLVAASWARANPNHLNGQQCAYLKRAVWRPVDKAVITVGSSCLLFAAHEGLDVSPIVPDAEPCGAPCVVVGSDQERETYTKPDTADFINNDCVAELDHMIRTRFRC